MLIAMFEKRSEQLERIDTGDYTPEEYARFLREIRFINRYLGDVRALEKTFLREIETENTRRFSVLDVGAGSGEMLRVIADFARKKDLKCDLFGLELNEFSAASILAESKNYAEIKAVRADAFHLPFADKSFDYAICSLFAHHFTDAQIPLILSEFKRVARRQIFVVDLHRHRLAYFSYKLFCRAFGISPLVREDGSLSVLRGFKPKEMEKLGECANLKNIFVRRITPFRLVLSADAN